MTDDEIDLIADTLGPVVKDLIAHATSQLALRIAAQDVEIAALKSRPAPEVTIGFAGAIRNQNGELVVSLTNGQLVNVGPVNGKDGVSPAASEIEVMVAAAVVAEVAKTEAIRGAAGNVDAAEVAALILPNLGVFVAEEMARINPGACDKTVDAAEIAAIVKAEVEPGLRDLTRALMAEIPAPKDGESADPADTERMVAAEVQRQMAGVPADIERSVAAELGQVVAALPKVDEMRSLVGSVVAEEVTRVVAALPKAEDGHTPSEDDIRPLVEASVADAVTRAVAALPKAEDGRTPTEDDLRPLVTAAVGEEVTRAVAALPKAEDGHTPGEDDLRPLVTASVAEAVTRAVAALPKAEDGHSPTEDDLRPLVTAAVAEEVARAVAALPKIKDGHTPSEDEILPVVTRVVADEVGRAIAAKPEAIARAVEDEVARIVPDLVADGLQRAVATLPKPEDGRTPTEDDIQPLVARTVDAVFATMPRPKDGENGRRGASVMDAEINADGQMVLRMSDGRNVVVQGRARGEPGKPGDKPKDGAPGRDAIEITVRPGIDDTRSYPPGIYAAWGGGVIGSVRQTDPIVDGDIVAAGWFVAQCGIAEEMIRESDDGRVIERVTRYTDGRTFTHRSTTATPIYRGIWKDGRYERGDMVTRDGSVWHCERSTDERPGDGASTWVLSVKRGRDGREPVKRDLPPPGPVKL